MKKKKSEILLPSFGSHLPGGPSVLQTQNVYPLALRTDDGFDLDYSSLMLVDRIVIDQVAFDYIQDSARPYLKSMKESVNVLADSGFLICRDYGGIVANNHDEIQTRISGLVDHPEFWLDTVRSHWDVYKQEIPELVSRYGAYADPKVEHLHFGVYTHLLNQGDRIDFVEAARLHKLLESKKKRLTAGERNELREIVRPILTQLMVNSLLQVELDAPFIDWQDLDEYYKKLNAPIWESNDEVNVKTYYEKNKTIFDIALPELKPNSVQSIVKFLKNKKAVTSLKKEISTSIRNGYQLDSAWAAEIRDRANEAQIVARRRQRILSWVGIAAGGLPVGPAAEAMREAAELGTDLAQEGLGSAMESRSLKSFEWYYALLRIKYDKK